MSIVPELQDFVQSAIQSENNNNYTAIPCIVVNVRNNGNDQMVDIQPTINQMFKDGTVKERPVILGVPVSFPVSDKAGMTFPINPGSTTGMAVFSMRSMDAWKAGNGRPSAPLNFSKMDKSDAVFFPGIQPPGMAVNNPAKHVHPHNTSDLVVFQNLGGVESEVRLKADGSIEVNTSSQAVTINCSDANINASGAINLDSASMTIDCPNTSWVGNINLTGNIVQSGNYTMNGVATFNSIPFSTHKHVGVSAGSATSGGPTA